VIWSSKPTTIAEAVYCVPFFISFRWSPRLASARRRCATGVTTRSSTPPGSVSTQHSPFGIVFRLLFADGYTVALVGSGGGRMWEVVEEERRR
jgi:hypothetical protein